MQSILPWIGIVILFLTGWAVVKKYQVNMVLLLGGLALNILAVAGGLTSFLPKNAAATGFVGFDFMELLRAISRTQIAGVGFIILVSGGFAEYMKAIGASDRFVTVCAKPLSLIKNPYLILAAVFIFGHCLGLIITSAAGLAMLMVVTVYPLIIRVGCSSLAAAAVVASVLAIGYAPASGVAVMAAELVHLDPIQYLVQYQLPMAVPTILAMAVAHVVVQYWFDKHDNIKGETADLQELEEKRKVLENVPAIYAVLPIIPIVLLLIFNKMVYQSITLNVATAMFIAWVLSFFVDLIVRRDAKKSFDLSFAMFKGMGSILTSTVGLIFVAAFFATGLQNIGIVNMLIEGAKHIGLGETGTGVFLSAVIGVVTVLTGSGVAAFTSLAHIIPDVAAHLNSDGISIMLMMHTASEMLRAISPVAGVVIIVAGFAKVNPLKFFKKTFDAQATAFTTTSSVGTMPITIDRLIRKVGVDEEVANFTAPLGTTIGMAGCTCVWPILLAMFYLNATGQSWGVSQYLVMCFMCLVLSLGSAGMPGVGVITAVSLFSAVNLPIAAVVLLIPINNITDMVRTLTNVTDASVCAAVVARQNGLLNDEVFAKEDEKLEKGEA